MWQTAGPVLFVVFVWWFTTGLVMLLGRLPARTHPVSLAAATILLVASLIGLKLTSEAVTTTNVVVTFCCIVGIWAWHEMAFLFGYVTGTRVERCPDWASGWTRFRFAFAALSHHELALLATFIGVVLLTWGGENLYGLGAFAILWLMRITAKLNLFLGVPHFSADVLPMRLAYLASYFRRRQVRAFFLTTLVLSSAVAAYLIWLTVVSSDLTPADMIAMIMLISLLLLAILEHLFMAVPFADIALWRWAQIDEGDGSGRPLNSPRHCDNKSRRCDTVEAFATRFKPSQKALKVTPTPPGGD